MLFNSVDFENFVVVEYIRRPLMPPIRVHGVKIPGRPGIRFTESEMDEGNIEVDVRIIEKDRMQAQLQARHVAGLLYTTEPKKLILRDQPTTYNLAMISGDTDFEKFLHTGFSTLKFNCPDPLSYSLTETVVNNIQGTTITNDGTYPAKGVLTVKPGAVTDLKITLQQTGEYIYIHGPLSKDDTVVINTEEEWVRLNGNLIMTRLDISSDFFALPVGTSRITTSSGTIQIKYRKRWVL